MTFLKYIRLKFSNIILNKSTWNVQTLIVNSSSNKQWKLFVIAIFVINKKYLFNWTVEQCTCMKTIDICTHCIHYMQTGGVACTWTLVCGVRSISKFILIIHLKTKCMRILKSPIIALITTGTVYKLLRFYNSCRRYVTPAKCKFRSTCSYTGIFFWTR